MVSFVSNVRRGAEGLFLRVFDTYGNKVMRGAGQQVGQLAVQVTIGLQEAGGRASAAMASLMGKDPGDRQDGLNGAGLQGRQGHGGPGRERPGQGRWPDQGHRPPMTASQPGRHQDAAGRSSVRPAR